MHDRPLKSDLTLRRPPWRPSRRARSVARWWPASSFETRPEGPLLRMRLLTQGSAR